MLDIIGIGDTDVDIMIQVPHIPSHDEKVRGKLAGVFAGGIIANFCSAAAAFGAKTGAVCKVGKDEYGKISMRDLESRGVDISHMVIDADADTYFAVIHLDETGEKALTIVETSAFLPKKEELNIEYLRQAKRVHMTTLDLELVEYIGQLLEGTDAKLSLDIEGTAPNADMGTWRRILQHVDVAFPNESGLLALTNMLDIEEGAEMLLEMGVNMVVVTCGAAGVRVYKEKYRYEHPAYHVEVKDTTGAGDCFNAVFLTGLTREWEIEKCAKYASAAAAISISKIGSRSAQPTIEQVEKFLLSQKPEDAESEG